VTLGASDYDNDLTGYSVHIGDYEDYNQNPVCPGVYSDSQTIQCDLQGRYITIVAAGESIIRLCEVEAFEF